MDIVFCVDRGVLPGLHVAAYSLLDRIHPSAGSIRFFVFSDALNELDAVLLRQTLAATGKSFALELRRLNPEILSAFPPLNGSLAAYYRLLAAQVMEAERFLYVDADTLCDIDVSELNRLDMGTAPVGWVPEAPMSGAVDWRLAEQLSTRPGDLYFNSGVLLVNVPEWRRQKVTDRCLEYISRSQPDYHDQSALNYVLFQNSVRLEQKFNCLTNQRKNWRALVPKYGRNNNLIHFIDSPKPWNFLAECFHPHYELWKSVMTCTAIRDYRSWRSSPARKFPTSRKTWIGYKKALKDRLLFAGYQSGWLKRVKGVTPLTAS